MGEHSNMSFEEDIVNEIEIDSTKEYESTASSPVRKKFNLIKITMELQDIIINILKQKVKLIELKQERYVKCIVNSNIDQLKAVYEISQKLLPFSKLCVLNVEHEKFLMDDKYNIIRETLANFKKYREAYNKCACFLDDMCHRALTKQNIEIEPRMVSNLEPGEHLASYNENIASSKRIFSEYESLLEHSLIASGNGMINKGTDFKENKNNLDEAFDKEINHLLTATEKAELSFNQIKLVIFDYDKRF